MKRQGLFSGFVVCLLLLCSMAPVLAQAAVPDVKTIEMPPPPQDDPGPPVVIEIPNANMPIIQVALLIDTSGSMQGLIEQAKVQLWSIVSELAKARKDGFTPEFHVALYEYGKSSLPATEGFIRQILPFTNDLDKLSEQLFPLRTNGGLEYCGMVIKRAADELSWENSPSALKLIFVAGNEPFTQGDIDYKESCAAAAAMDISVNTIHCGSLEEGIRGAWDKGAQVGKGSYFHIDHNRAGIAAIAAPQDAEIIKLNSALNATYLAYGQEGKKRQELQTAIDGTLSVLAGPAGAADRAAAKATGLYRNDAWDLLDAVTNNAVKLDEVKTEELPEIMQTMTLEEKTAYLATMLAERKTVQQQINALNLERNAFLEEEMKKLGNAGEQTLKEAALEAIRTQANLRGFEM